MLSSKVNKVVVQHLAVIRSQDFEIVGRHMQQNGTVIGPLKFNVTGVDVELFACVHQEKDNVCVTPFHYWLP